MMCAEESDAKVAARWIWSRVEAACSRVDQGETPWRCEIGL